MNTEKFDVLQDRSSVDLASRFQAMKEHAEHVVAQQVEKMKAAGEAYELSNDEERLLRAYRAFTVRSKPGSVFSWKSPIDGPSIVLPTEPQFVCDPREVNVG